MKKTTAVLLALAACILFAFSSCGQKAENLQEYITNNEDNKAAAAEKMKVFEEYYPNDRVSYIVKDNTLKYTITVEDAGMVKKKGSCRAKYNAYADQFEQYADEIKKDSSLDEFEIVIQVVDKKGAKAFERTIKR